MKHLPNIPEIGGFPMEAHEREFIKLIAELTADVRTIKDAIPELKAGLASQQNKTERVELQLAKMEAKQPTKYPWFSTVAGISGLASLAVAAPIILNIIHK